MENRLHQISSLTRSLKTFLFAFIFFCLSNFHHLSKILESTSVHLTIVPVLLLTDVLDIIFMITEFYKCPNKNMGTATLFIFDLIRISLGMTAGIFLNYIALPHAILIGQILVVAGLALGVLTNATSALIQTKANQTVHNREISASIKGTWQSCIVLAFLLSVATVLFFVPSTVPIIIASILGTCFMLGASIYSLFQAFDPPFKPQKTELSQDKQKFSYYSVLNHVDLNQIKNIDKVKQLIQNKITNLESVQTQKPTFEQAKLQDKIGLLRENLELLNNKEKPILRSQSLKKLQVKYPLAFQSFFKRVSDTEALLQLSEQVLRTH